MSNPILLALVAVAAFALVAIATRRTSYAIPVTVGGWRQTTFFRLRDAERFLDKLENEAVARRELLVAGKRKFVVRWVP